MYIHIIVYLICLDLSYTIFWLALSMLLFILGVYSSRLSCFMFSMCADMSDIHVLCMTAIFLCDACVACLCGSHIYSLTSNSLVLVNLVSLDLVFDMKLVASFVL